MDFIEELRAWASANQLGDVAVWFEEGPTDRPKRSATVVAERRGATGDITAAGQVTVWETGECDLSAETLNGKTLFQKTRTLTQPGEVAAEADDLVAHLMRSPIA